MANGKRGAPSSRRRARPRLATVAQVAGVALAGAVTVALTVAPLRPPPTYDSTQVTAAAVLPAPSAASTPVPTSSASTTTPSPPTSASTLASTTGAATLPVGLVLGDGFAVRPAAQTSFACLAITSRGWACDNRAGAGSGYVSGGTVGSYAVQLAAAATAQDVGLVVISGGAVDGRASTATISEAARTLVEATTTQFPRATVLVLSPFPVKGATTPALIAASITLKGLADGIRVQYVDTTSWFAGVSTIVAVDGTSLTPQSTTVAQSALAGLVPTATTPST